MHTQSIKIGTRKSKLAMWQAHHVAHLLQNSGIDPIIVPIETKGDKVLNVALSKIGSKGVFTEELEDMLRNGEIDIAVHSAKDLPSSLPDGFRVLSFCERESPEDVIVAEKEIDLESPNLVLGTSSTRRIALLKHHYPAIQTMDARGNLQTRIGKLQSGDMDGLVLAYAGIKRMEYDHLIQHKLDIAKFVPPVGQGAVAIEVHEQLGSELHDKIKRATNHAATERVIRTERAFLREMNGGCSIPVFGHATLTTGGVVLLTGGIVSLDGQQLIRTHATGDDEEKLGISVAQTILNDGGDAILEKIKAEFDTK